MELKCYLAGHIEVVLFGEEVVHSCDTNDTSDRNGRSDNHHNVSVHPGILGECEERGEKHGCCCVLPCLSEKWYLHGARGCGGALSCGTPVKISSPSLRRKKKTRVYSVNWVLRRRMLK